MQMTYVRNLVVATALTLTINPLAVVDVGQIVPLLKPIKRHCGRQTGE